jgi:UDP-N-acetylmuramoylalanine--D-glutamate ligase
MRNKDYFRGKHIVVAGFARSGLASANLLFSLGANVRITDNQDNDSIRRNIGSLKSPAIKLELGRHTLDFIRGADILVLSPGVPNDAPVVAWAMEAGIPVISEIELAWILCPAQVIAITGTNGKTTVTTLVGKVIEASGRRAFTCGNIGNPFCAEVEKMREGDFVALEVSSFQLEHIDTFKPRVAAILNLSRNHLDRYSGMQDYLSAKKRIFKNQESSDFLVLNYDDPEIRGLDKEARAKVGFFKKEEGLNPNQSAVLAITGALNIDRGVAIKVFRDFKGVEHRMEEAARIGKVCFINDSKSTNTESTLWALNNLSAPVILIAGGREKGNDYSGVLESARGKIKAAVLIGEAKEKISKVFTGSIDNVYASTLDEAVDKAFSLSAGEGTVLFSPMCKSFDMFNNYEERGRLFKKKVLELAGKAALR